jgi:hypothetical protein
MKEKILCIGCVVLFIILGFSFLSQNSQATNKETWEYTYINIGNAEPVNINQINNLGQQGWEMVAVIPTDEKFLPRIFFKRKKP